jgi:hypothetical protein
MVAIAQVSADSWNPGDVAVLRFPEHLVDRLDSGHEFFGRSDVDVLLGLRTQLGCVPDGGVQVGVGLEMIGLEVVGPKHEDLVFG